MGIGIPTLYLYHRLQQKGYIKGNQRVIELGSQDVSGETAQLASVLKNLFECKIDSETEITAKNLYQSIGFENYQCIDADGLHDALVFDLNQNIQKTYNFLEKFDLVTNHGTTEHCFNQYTCFLNIHNLCAINGLMIHVLPVQGYVNHGLFNYNPSFFYNLAAANNYKLIGVYLSTCKSHDPALYSIPGLIPYREGLVQSLIDFQGEPEMGLYVVLQKVKEQEFVMPYDGQYLNINLLSDRYSLQERDRSHLEIAPEFIKDVEQSTNRFESIPRTSTELDQLQAQLDRAHSEIEAMKTSKFWKLRTQWFKLKNTIGLPVN
ncbi:hypothetical protein [Lusitaniella coriacea]|uniref:hypothetical protein n=1 Tax=Lusitaniella coriacea TaxID=1983105 RepID=UPI003CF6CACF